MANSNAGIIQAELSIQVGQMLAGLKQAQAALVQFGQSAGAGMAPLDATVKSHGGFLASLREEQKEARQASRMTRFWTNELVDVIPAASGAKSAISGLVNVAAQGLISGMGFGVALAAVRAASEMVTEELHRQHEITKQLMEGALQAAIVQQQGWLRVRDLIKPATEGVKAHREEMSKSQGAIDKAYEAYEKVKEAGPGIVARARTIFGDPSAYDEFNEKLRQSAINVRNVAAAASNFSDIMQALIGEQQRKDQKRLADEQISRDTQAARKANLDLATQRLTLAAQTSDRIRAIELNREAELKRLSGESGLNDATRATRRQAINERAAAEAEIALRDERNRIQAIEEQVRLVGELDEFRRLEIDYLNKAADLERQVATGKVREGEADAQRNRALKEYLASYAALATAEAARMQDLGFQIQAEAAISNEKKRLVEYEREEARIQREVSQKKIGADEADQLRLLNLTKYQAAAYQDAAHQSQAWGQTLGDALGGLVTGTLSLGQAFAQVGQAIVKQLVEMAIQAVTANAAQAAAGAAASQSAIPIIGPILAISAMGAMLSAVMGLVGNISPRALGGSVFPGTYLVGEAGPELLRIGNGVSGSVVPNHRLAMAAAGGARGGGVGANVNFTFNAPVDRQWWRDQQREIMRTVRDAVRGNR